ncbi:hypothetical protein FEM48_Zijuj08G0021600 [Ziziphus jujuba var. spinosa]|uniref:non-specific serine/threonine protein kinase n=1 Tax=Ziziphus jujuba var. spinosa TaxID=714518 RepID=A0A978UWD6_ZIZJJ|nr:hypothetical protein FEM48_Zijuj08G0021600 [Ziziphus jujuba var. spinosa]
MAIKKHTWISIVTSCYKSEVQPSPKPKKLVAKQSSFQRISITDLSNPSSTLSEDLSISLAGSNIHVFTLAELKVITQNFSSSNFLGEGGFGPVHKGFIDDKLRPGLKAQPVAVKLLDLDGTQGHREWLTEVIFLGQLRHPHLVKLIGYCCEDEHRLLVYEYMPRGSLENQLFRRYSVSLPWSTRMKIALGAAKGLSFLHEAEKPVIYRDFKASNILLDSDYTPKLSDFGLAKDGPEGDDTHVSTRVMGTQGYAAPEYIMTGAKKAAALAYQCLSHRPKQRPTMSTVVKTLEPLKDFDDLPIGPFVFTFPTETQFCKEELREGGEALKQSKKENGHHHYHNGHKHHHKSPKSPNSYSERNGLNSPLHHRARGA